jgi:ABC-type polysaccharide/polyol phosphate transport system ATPase subunit
MKEPAIQVQNLRKTFHIRMRPAEGVLAHGLSLLTNRGETRELKVLDDVSLHCEPGEILGIVGPNGCGKSTLLRIIAGIYRPDSGTIRTRGEVVYLSGFNIGLQGRLTMRENIYLIGSIMGLRKREIEGHFEKIIGFSGLREFLDTNVYQFSSGMVARLGFSCGISFITHRNPGVILLDEVFGAGGDAEFQAAAAGKMEEFVRSGAAVILVSHNMVYMEKYCSRAILLDKGHIVAEGEPREIAEKYA